MRQGLDIFLQDPPKVAVPVREITLGKRATQAVALAVIFGIPAAGLYLVLTSLLGV